MVDITYGYKQPELMDIDFFVSPLTIRDILLLDFSWTVVSN